VLVS